MKNFVPHKNKHLLYYAYIYLKIKYGIEVYGTANATQIKKVQVKQNRAWKVLFNKDFLTPTDSLHKELEVLKVKDINRLHTAKFVHMQQNNKTPNIFKNFFIAIQTVHQHNTRQNHNLHINQPNTNNGKRTMKYHGATIWNALAGSLRKIESNKTFGSPTKKKPTGQLLRLSTLMWPSKQINYLYSLSLYWTLPLFYVFIFIMYLFFI